MDLQKGLPLDCSTYIPGMKTSLSYQPFESTDNYSPPDRQPTQGDQLSPQNYLKLRFNNANLQFGDTTSALNLPEPCITTSIDSSFTQPSICYGETHGAIITAAQHVPAFNSNFYASNAGYNPWQQQYGSNAGVSYPGYTYSSQGISTASGYGYPIINNSSLAAGKFHLCNSHLLVDSYCLILLYTLYSYPLYLYPFAASHCSGWSQSPTGKNEVERWSLKTSCLHLDLSLEFSTYSALLPCYTMHYIPVPCQCSWLLKL